MACKSCQERARMLAAARAKDGIKGVVRVIPAVGRHLLNSPPEIRGNQKWPEAESGRAPDAVQVRRTS